MEIKEIFSVKNTLHGGEQRIAKEQKRDRSIDTEI